MFDQAEKSLMTGWPVILDATFSRRRFRDDARVLAEKTGVQFRILWYETPLDVLNERLSKRISNSRKPSVMEPSVMDPSHMDHLARDPSDAGPEILELQARDFEPLSEEEKRFTSRKTGPCL